MCKLTASYLPGLSVLRLKGLIHRSLSALNNAGYNKLRGSRRIEFGQQAREVERPVQHPHVVRSSPIPRPPHAWVTIPGQLDTVALRIAQINGFVAGMIAGSVDRPAVIQQALERRS